MKGNITWRSRSIWPNQFLIPSDSHCSHSLENHSDFDSLTRKCLSSLIIHTKNCNDRQKASFRNNNKTIIWKQRRFSWSIISWVFDSHVEIPIYIISFPFPWEYELLLPTAILLIRYSTFRRNTIMWLFNLIDLIVVFFGYFIPFFIRSIVLTFFSKWRNIC